ACAREHPGTPRIAATPDLAARPVYVRLHLRQGLDALTTYRFGQSRQGLNCVADSVTEALKNPADRAALAGLLLEKLADGATPDGKQFILREFALLGRPEDAPALGRWLGDPALGEMARYAIDRIPGGAADKALRDALPGTVGPVRIGIINSIGERRDRRAVGMLRRLVEDPDPETAAAATAALGKIGDAGAARALRRAAVRATNPERRRGLTEARLCCADRLRADGQTRAALDIYNEMARPDQPWRIQAAALVGVAKTTGIEAWPLVSKALTGDDPKLRQVAFGVLPDLPGARATAQMTALLPGLPPDGKATMLGILTERGDATARPSVLGALDDPDEAVRVAATEALGRLGDAASLPVLLARLTRTEGPERDATLESLSRLPGGDIDATIRKNITAAEPWRRIDLIGVLGRRGAADNVPALLELAGGDPDAGVRVAALRALGDLAAPGQCGAILTLLAAARTDGERTAGRAAVIAVSQRLPEAERAEPVLRAYRAATAVRTRCDLLSVLGVLGGPGALDAAVAALGDAEPQVSESALRALAEWPGPQPVRRLLEIAGGDASQVSRVLALRGVVRQMGMMEEPPGTMLALFNAAMQAARRPEDRKMVLSALANVHSLQAYDVAAGYLEDPSLREESIAVILKLATALRGPNPRETIAMLDKAIAAATDPEQHAVAQEMKDLIGNVFLTR
ncbi:MAG: HEAT repeat domain-containing protein, partial [bacterium]|nr:HEAT repeat domain-containing protein [bacterium]